jgi:hypothetical protein
MLEKKIYKIKRIFICWNRARVFGLNRMRPLELGAFNILTLNQSCLGASYHRSTRVIGPFLATPNHQSPPDDMIRNDGAYDTQHRRRTSSQSSSSGTAPPSF